MKNFILLITLLSFFGNINSQIVLSEDCESGFDANGLPIAGGWAEMGLSSDGIYMIGDATDANANLSWPVPAHTMFLQTNDDVCDCDKSEDRIILPVQDFSTFTNTVTLTTDLYWDDEFLGEVSLEVSTDGGFTWDLITFIPSQADFWQDAQTFDLTAYNGQPSVLISFLYNDQVEWGNGFAIDNIILEHELLNAEFSVDFSMNCVGADFNFTDASTGSATSWDWDFGVDATPATFSGQFPPAVTYSSEGLKTITLNVNTGQDVETKVDFIEVFDIPTIDNAPGSLDQELCGGALTADIIFTGTGGGGASGSGNGVLEFEWSYVTNPLGQDIGLTSPGTGNIPGFIAVNISGAPIVATFTVTPQITDGAGGSLACGGDSPLTFTITVNPSFDPTFSYAQTSYCLGTADELPNTIATTGGTFSSTTPGFVDPMSGLIAISSFPVATYDITYDLAGLCPSSSMITVDIIDAPTVDAITDFSLCDGASGDILFTGTASQFDWTYTNSTTTNIGIPFAGTGDIVAFTSVNGTVNDIVSTFTVTPVSGTCSGTDMTFDFTVNSVIDATFSYAQTVYCAADPVNPSASATNPGTFTASPAGLVFADLFGTIDLAASMLGTYTVTNSFAGTCPSSFDFDVEITNSGDPSFSISNVSVCEGDIANSPVTTIDGDAGGVFSSTAGLTIDAVTGTIDVTSSTFGQYVVTYTLGGSCPASSTVDFELLETPVIMPMADQTVCAGQVIPDIPLSSLSTFVIDWTNDNTTTGISNISGSGDISSFIATNSPVGSAPKVSVIDLTATNGTCVSNVVSFNFTVNALPSVNGGNDVTICEGANLTMTGTGNAASFAWDNGVVNAVSFVPAAGSYIYTVTGTTGTCTNTDQVNVTVNVAPTVNAGADLVACAGTQTLLTGSGATTLTWNNGVTNNVPFIASVSGNYIVTGVNSFGCSNKDTMVLTIEALPIPSFTSNVTSGCIPTQVVFDSSPTTNSCVYSISDGTILPGCNGVVANFSSTGVYDVTLTQVSVNNCVGTTTVNAMIVINPDPVASFTAEKVTVNMIDPSNFFENTSTGAIGYEWDFGDNSLNSFNEDAVHTFPGDLPGMYTVTLIATTQFGCVDSASVTMEVEESSIFYISNSFTPNGDELNNKFEPFLYAGFDPQDYNLKIFARNGELIFESNDASVGWDGDYGANRGLAPTGTYTYKLQFNTSTKDEKKVIVGTVNLLR